VHWDVTLILLPLAGAMLAFLFPRVGGRLGLLTAFSVLFAAIALAAALIGEGVQRHLVGGWPAPLGITLRTDGLSMTMLLTAAVVGLGISLYAAVWFRQEPLNGERFWPLWLLLWGAFNALFLSADLFNLYVTLELLGLSAVGLAAVAGGGAAYAAAMRYLLVSLIGSLLYLLGVALIYHACGSVDIALVAARLSPSAASGAALALMVTGLLLKSALFPLHFWLPAAHANAGAPVSAALSGLVVKATFYLLLRLWLELFDTFAPQLETLLGLLGAAAVLWGSLQALRQSRLKLLIAYSTVAQIGYLFMAFPLAAAAGLQAWYGALYLVMSHALAKSAMFLAAGNLRRHAGHDRIAELDLVAQRLPLSVSAFALAGMTIMGLPPSGGFIAKWWLLQAALVQGMWWWALVLVAGGLMSAAYLFKVVGFAFTRARGPHEACPVPLSMEWIALLLAVGSVLLGLLVLPPMALLGVGDPFGLALGAGR
jgi:formate hydrogenlyase subunit 3/multisubunit Na+/H+ antiporter MnhD subunit